MDFKANFDYKRSFKVEHRSGQNRVFLQKSDNPEITH
jgi:hypothetical protein